MAAPPVVATATDDIENTAPQHSETAWGRLVSDALRTLAKSDVALVNAGSLKPGTLPSGAFTQAQIDALLNFPADDIVVLPLQGAALRSALELSLRAYPTGSPAYLQGSGWTGTFNPQAPAGKRVTALRINGKEISNNTTYQVAMPVSLAQGANGYFAYWNDAAARSLKTTISAAIADYCHNKHTLSPPKEERIKGQ